MICNSCGKQNPDGSDFCSGCGNRLSASGNPASQYSAPNTSSQPYYPPPQPVAPPPYYGGSNSQYVPNRPYVGQNLTGSQSSFSQNWRAAAGSPVFLVAVLIYSLSFLITLIQIMDQVDNLSYMLYRSGFRGMNGTFMLLLFLMLIPNVLFGIGLWLIYAEGKKTQGLPIKTTGLSMVFGVVIFQFVLICIVLLILFVYACIELEAASRYSRYSYYYSSSVSSDIGFAIGIILIVAGLVIGFYTCLIRMLSNMKNAVFQNSPNTTCVTVVAVFCFIMGGFTFIGALKSSEAIFQALLSSSQMILFGIALIQYKNKMLYCNTPYYGMR